jgi:uncharacterized protein
MRFCFLVCIVALTACGPKRDEVRDFFGSTEITMPNGQTVIAERVSTPIEMARGLMFRDSLAADRGMLFVWATPGNYSGWMYQVKIPLDIIWMDLDCRVVEIAANAPPCREKSAKLCPHFGGTKKAQYMLELPAGMAAKYGVQPGSVLTF